MRWRLDKNRPLCPQICEQISVGIAKGDFKKDERLLSVREVAVNLNVNPNTVQKAFEQLEAQGLIYSQRGSGWYVADSREAAQQTVDVLIEKKTAQFFEDMGALGIDMQGIKTYVEEWNK